ncbi:alpha/beta hydrolase [Speluncibacter jeojiensis]|uniref:alpha/beta hydrolase n=1 Tax=Speluncibacter jeojiensis TaxID=2710754 RepID=UPI00240F1012|nr:alpha/beta hydrolase [Rhodococcus sp. D2-41]
MQIPMSRLTLIGSLRPEHHAEKYRSESHVDGTFMAGASLRSQVLQCSLSRTVNPFLRFWAHFPDLPWPAGAVDSLARTIPPPRHTTRRAVRLENCRAELLAAAEVGSAAGADRVLLYLHGGGFVVCGPHTHRDLVARVSAAADAPALIVDYRMLPKHTIADAVADGVDGYRWLLDEGWAPEQIVVCGDSAGGFLTFAVAVSIRDEGLPLPAGLAAMSPLIEVDPTRKLAHRNADRCAVIPAQAMVALSNRLVREEGTPVPTPADADLRGMPPTLIQIGSREFLLPDAELMAQRLTDAGGSCELQVWQGQVHVFQAAAGIIPEARLAIAALGEFIRKVTWADPVVRSGQRGA